MNERFTLALSAALLALPLTGCNNKKPEPAPASTPASAQSAAPRASNVSSQAASATPPAAPAGAADVTLEWTVPASWTQGPPKPMRKATYFVPATAGDSAQGELAISYFGTGQGGDVEANIKRWLGQFKDVKEDAITRSERVKDDLKISLVEVSSGTFNASTMMMGPHGGGSAPDQKDYALLGAIVEAPSGKYFFKLTGPKATVAASKDAFDGVLDSLKQK